MDLPNVIDSRFPQAVMRNMKNSEPRYPPKIVCNWEEFNQGLYICIPERMRMELMSDKTKDVPLDVAVNIKR